MMLRNLIALLLAASLCGLTACQSPEKQRPKDGDYDSLSPFENQDDPFARVLMPEDSASG